MPETLTRQAIAVYDPEDPWEAAIQEAAKQFTGNWLPSFACQLLAKSVASLKLGTDWLEREDLLPVRAHYLFAPYLTGNKGTVVFPTHLLFLRDIVENGEIASNLHKPIVFVAEPLALFLFRDSPVHIHVNHDLLRASNPKVEFLDVGGMLMCDKGDVVLDHAAIREVKCHGSEMNKERTSSLLQDIRNEHGVSFSKAAAREIAPDVFELDEHFPELMPETEVWDKVTRSKAEVTAVEKSENGSISVKYPDGNEISVLKQEFDQQFVVGSNGLQS